VARATDRLEIRVTPDERVAWDVLARDQRTTVSKLIRKLMNEFASSAVDECAVDADTGFAAVESSAQSSSTQSLGTETADEYEVAKTAPQSQDSDLLAKAGGRDWLAAKIAANRGTSSAD
jgi:hypothetical protein